MEISSTKDKKQTAYQDTPIGKIPADWEVKRLGEIIKGKGEYGINAPAVPYDKNLPKYIRITDIDDEGNFSTEKITSVICETASDYSLKEGDILFVRTGATTGKAYLYKKDDGELVFAGFLIRFKIDDKIADKYFVWSYTKTTKYENWVRKVSQRSGQPGLNSNEYSSLLLPLPPLPEQQRIAEVLSTWDQAIQCTEQLILQKEQRKKWLMQKLLTGKIRLKGFSGEWKEMKIGDTGIIPQKTAITKIENHKLLTVRLHTKGIEFNERDKPILSKTGRPYYERYKGEILIGRQNIHNGGIGLITEEFDGHICSNAITSFIVTRNCTTEYLLYYLQYPRYYQMIENYMGGTGQKELSEKQFLEIPIRLPNTIEEQTAIAEVLQTADKEIELLKAKAEKLKEQKKGLMQQLLTGRMRLNLITINK